MSRHDRRKAASQARKGDDTMGRSHSFGGALPPSVTEHPTYKEGARRAASGQGFPPAYFEAIADAARLIARWIASRPIPPDLKWLEWDVGRTFIAADLDVGAGYLADSDDAHALLAWLDSATGGKLSLNQAGWALRKLGLIPMPAERA